MIVRSIAGFAGCLFLLGSQVFAQNTALIDTATVASGLEIPWDLEWMGNDQLLVSERGGTISRVEISSGVVTPLVELDVAAEVHSGLMGLALHPSWPDSNAVFVCYSFYTPTFQILMRVERFRYEADTLLSESIILDSITGGSTTTGGRLAISASGQIFLSVGDIDNGILAQDSTSDNGKILRVNLDGSIPANNLLPGSPVYSMGHRNPQGLAFSEAGILYSSEHGPSSTDELNIIEPSRNYGWPQVLGFCDASSAQVCQDLNIREPLKTWSPPIAPAGLAWYPAAGFSAWAGSLLMTTLRGQSLRRLVLSSDGQAVESEEIYLDGLLGRLRDVSVSPDGRVFVCTSNRDLFGTPAAGDDRIVELTLSPLSVDQGMDPGIAIQQIGEGNWEISLSEGRFPAQIDVIDVSGKTVLHQEAGAGQFTARISLTTCPTGIYVILVRTESGYRSQKIRHNRF